MADSSSRAGAGYATPTILEYLERPHTPRDAALDFAFNAPATFEIPAIQVGPHEGAFLGWLLALAGAKQVVEVGTLVGYSGIHIARSLPAGGRLTTCELEPKHAEVARSAFERAGVADRVRILVGKASDSLARILDEGPFDAVFLDADKVGYLEYARWAAAALRPGGLLIADNVFYFGRLCDDSSEAASVRAFHEFAAREWHTAIVPTPDGLLVGRKR